MSEQNNKTFVLKTADVKPKWLILDATGKTLGRFASEVAKILRGKHKPTYTPHIDGGDGVIVINASKIHVTGAKEAQKNYRYYTGHIGGLREVPYRVMQKRKPTYIVERAITGMMPKTRLGKQQLRKLRIYAGAEHEQTAQQPLVAEI
jgi:large subunit ribosomal protein L13